MLGHYVWLYVCCIVVCLLLYFRISVVSFFSLSFDEDHQVLVCNPVLFFTLRFLTFEQWYTTFVCMYLLTWRSHLNITSNLTSVFSSVTLGFRLVSARFMTGHEFLKHCNDARMNMISSPSFRIIFRRHISYRHHFKCRVELVTNNMFYFYKKTKPRFLNAGDPVFICYIIIFIFFYN